MQKDIVGCRAVDVVRLAHQPDDVAVIDHDALGRAGRARGVDDVGGVGGMQARARGRRGMLCDDGPIGIEPHHGSGSVCGQPLAQRRLGEQHRGARIVEHEGEALTRVARDRAADRRPRP